MLDIVFLLWMAFADIYKCTLHGYVYQMPGEVASIELEDRLRCPMKIEQLKNEIILSSEHYWVRIVIPEWVRGNMGFQYQWGNRTAQIGGRTIDVDSGLIVKG